MLKVTIKTNDGESTARVRGNCSLKEIVATIKALKKMEEYSEEELNKRVEEMIKENCDEIKIKKIL